MLIWSLKWHLTSLENGWFLVNFMAFPIWTPLWGKIVDSSIWREPDHVRIVFITMLALKDRDHIVRANAYNIANRANKTEAEVLDALRVLSEPDGKRLEPQPHEGRRIKKVPEGYLFLNGEYYRKMMVEEMAKARNRRSQANFRRKTAMKRLPEPGYAEYQKALDAGASPDQLDEIITRWLPEAAKGSSKGQPSCV